jgi:drug/metabolite transporter (DMT)-like permease
VIYGLLAAVGFGLADFLTALTTRRIGTFLTLAVAQAVGTLICAVVFTVARPATGGAGAAVWLGLILSGALAAVAYVGLYRGLELGPVALVSPIVAADSAIAILLVVPVLHETVPGPGWVGVAAALVGVVMASVDPRSLRSPARVDRRGIAWALLSMAVFGVVVFVVGWAAKRYGWFLPMFCSRLGTMGVLLVAAAVARGRLVRRPPSGAFVWLAVVVGLVDLGGFAAFSRGSEVGVVSIVIAVSATFPLIPMVGGMIVFGERPARTQLAGALLVIAGLAVLGLST